ncbi:MAG TPA: co-chaperone GroES [bacterium]|nr:co-chaperone GroES [bacterium]
MAKPKVKPLGDRVLCKVLEGQEQKVGNIIVPDTAKERPQEAEVLAVGQGKYVDGKLVPLDVKAGDRILFGKYSGTEIKIDNDEYLILKESDILAVVG